MKLWVFYGFDVDSDPCIYVGEQAEGEDFQSLGEEQVRKLSDALSRVAARSNSFEHFLEQIEESR